MTEIPIKLFAVAVFFAWVPAILCMFALMRPRRAVIAAFVAGYLLLPEIVYRFHAVPDVNKGTLTAFGVLLGSLIFDGARLFRVRPRLIDLPWFILMLVPIGASLSNDLTFMDGLSASLNLFFRWGLAYWIGRAYITDWEGIRELSLGIIIGALAYVPLCWWEIRMSPQLHGWIYGPLFTSFRTDTYLFGVQLFGFRPNVFLADGLTVTMYMGISAVLAYWAWMSGSPKRLLGMPMGAIALTLIITAFFSKAVGGIVLMGLGMTVLTLTRWPKTRLPALILMLAAPAYVTLRSAGDWSGEVLVNAANAVSPTRAESLEFRLRNENLLTAKALQHPLLGWAGWSRSHVYDLENNDITIIDGLWIILIGETGLLGLAAFTTMVIGSAILLWKRIPTRYWSDPACSAAVALAVVITMYMIDSLFNSTFNPVTALAIGAVASIGAVAKSVFSRSAQRSVPFATPAYAGATALVASPKDLPYVYSTY
jgi:hypothetical protein